VVLIQFAGRVDARCEVGEEGCVNDAAESLARQVVRVHDDAPAVMTLPVAEGDRRDAFLDQGRPVSVHRDEVAVEIPARQLDDLQGQADAVRPRPEQVRGSAVDGRPAGRPARGRDEPLHGILLVDQEAPEGLG
jgi:hypothetical protein